jgi:glucose/arabinose dehydrogenase
LSYSAGDSDSNSLRIVRFPLPEVGNEITQVESGQNYGWPTITNGKDYSGALITPFMEYKGMRQPDHDWTPSIAPSGMILYVGTGFPSVTDHLFVTSLKFKQLRALRFNNNQITDERILLADLSID